MSKYKAILFDFDGVLADTMHDNFAAWQMALRQFNATIASCDFFPLEGMKVLDMAENICRIVNINVAQAPRLLETKDRFFVKNSHTRLYPHVENFIDLLNEKSIPVGIVSGGRRERIERSTPADFLKKFNSIVTGDDVLNGKPDPEPFLKCARAIKVNIKNCIVIENAPLGVQSAKKAGAYCIAIKSTVDKSHLSLADAVIDNFGELPKIEVIHSLFLIDCGK